MTKRTVLMAGPLPPSIGGMASVIRDLMASKLARQNSFVGFDTGKQTPQGRSMLSAVSYRIGLWRRWIALLRAKRPCIAHIHTCSGLSYFLDGALCVLARVLKVPVVLHIHGGRFDAFIDELGPASRKLVVALARWASRVVVLSTYWQDALTPRLPGIRLTVISNGVPVPTERERVERERPSVVFVGAVCREKGVETLIQATALLESRPDIFLVGPETQIGYGTHLRSLATKCGVGERLTLVGPASKADVSAWLRRATVFTLPSFVEALPISVLEAMAAGVPVVATRVGALPSVIDDGRTGLLVEPGDVPALAHALDTILLDPRLADTLGRAARTTCLERFGIDRTAETFECLYSELLPINSDELGSSGTKMTRSAA